MTSRSDIPTIGGELTLDVSDFVPRWPVRALLEEREHRAWLDLGRSALRIALRTSRALASTTKIWIPEYCCSSVINAARREGFSVEFYCDRPGMTTFQGPTVRDHDVFLYIHYFGKRNVAAEKWLNESRRPIFIIEDCVQAPLTKGVGSCGDFAIMSLRKFLAVPDGALISSRYPLRLEGIEQSSERAISERITAKLLRGKGLTDDRVFLDMLTESETLFDSGNPAWQSWISSHLMRNVDIEFVAERRRTNWFHLHDWYVANRGRISGLRPVFDELEPDEVPLGFAIQVHPEVRQDLRDALARKRIFCAVHWNIEELPDSGATEDSRQLSRSILTLPIDQQGDMINMARVTSELENYFATRA